MDVNGEGPGSDFVVWLDERFYERRHLVGCDRGEDGKFEILHHLEKFFV
jgi:hypothetical protein